MKILITGGAGYLGFELAKQLVEQADVEHIVLYDNFSRKNFQALYAFCQHPKVSIEQAELLDRDKLTRIVKQVDTVCHLAAQGRAPHQQEYSHLFEQTNHWGTAQLCSIIEKQPHIEHFLFTSSAAIYGLGINAAYHVKDEPVPISQYGLSKFNAEKQLIRIQDKVKCSNLRIGNVFGYSPTMHYGSLINLYCLNTAFKHPLLIHGSGEQYRPFIHIKRAAQALTFFLSQDNQEQYALYNVYDYNLSVNQIIEAFTELDMQFEHLHVNRHHRMKDLKLEGAEQLAKFIGSPNHYVEDIKHSLIL